jgi:hypothetical protein
VIIAVASGLMLLFFASYAHAEPIADLKVSDISQFTSIQEGGAGPFCFSTDSTAYHLERR